LNILKCFAAAEDEVLYVYLLVASILAKQNIWNRSSYLEELSKNCGDESLVARPSSLIWMHPVAAGVSSKKNGGTPNLTSRKNTRRGLVVAGLHGSKGF